MGTGVTKEEFDALTPREVQWRLDALDRRDDDAWQRTAQLAAWVFQALGSKVSANKLLGKDETADVARALLQ